MKSRIRFILIFLLFSLFGNIQTLLSQELIQSFVEANINDTGERFGKSVKSAGDVNNDSYDDVIVGSEAYSSGTGRAYIYFGGSSMDNSADVIMTGGDLGNYFGCSVSYAGDVNNDSYDDVIVGAYGYSSNKGRVYIYYGGSSMDNIADVTMTGQGGFFGKSVSYAGDVNTDSYDDVIVGASGYNWNNGRVYIYYGGGGMDNIADVVITGGGNSFGCSVSYAGDVNNDSYDDVIVGKYANYSTSGFASSAYIYFGGSNMDSSSDITLYGAVTPNNDNFGTSVSYAGDVNNDSYDDVIVGNCEFSSCNGLVHLYYGGSNMNNYPSRTFNGPSGGNNFFGYSVSNAGDVNNDSYDDIIVGTYGYSSNRGRIYIYYGNGGYSMNTTADVIINGEGANDFFGYSVSYAGDINNDSNDDVIVGAYGYSSYQGRAYIYCGSSSMDSNAEVMIEGIPDNYFGISVSYSGDVNNDSYDDVIVGAEGYSSNKGRAYIYYGGSSMDNTADVIITGGGTGYFFGSSVSNAGDVNNDSYDDVIVGIRGYDFNKGRACIYYGGSNMDNYADVIMDGEGTGDYFGCAVSNAGDVNNDSYADVIVGAWGYSSNTGRAYIYYGGSSMENTFDVILTGEGSGNYFGCAVSNAGDVNNDLYADVIVGARGYSSNTGRTYIYYGSNSMDNIADVTMDGEETGNYFGRSISNTGDVNNDSYDDVIVGAYCYSANRGRAYIYYGGGSMNNIADVTMTGEGSDNYFGCSVSYAGDFNNDSYDDVIVGAERYSNYQGRVYIYYGGSSMNNTADVILTGEGSGNYFGRSVSYAGYVTDNNINNIIIGADGYPENGKAYLYGSPRPQSINSGNNYAINFDGDNDYITIPHDASFNNITDALTVCAWINPDGPQNNWAKVLIKNTDTSYPYLLGYTTGGESQQIYFRIFNGTSGYSTNESSVLTVANTWQHVAGVYDGSKVKIYINGILKDEASASGNIAANTQPVTIGGRVGQTQGFDGEIDEVSLWSTALSQTEIQEIMHREISNSHPKYADLISYWKLNEGENNVAVDSKGSNQGTLTNMTLSGETSNWVLSHVELGTNSIIATSTSAVSCGSLGRRVTVTNESLQDANSYLCIYQLGEGNIVLSSADIGTWPATVTGRFDVIWGIQEYGSVTTNLEFEYGGIDSYEPGKTNVRLLKRADANSSWTDITSLATNDFVNKKFLLNGQTEFSEFSLGKDDVNPLPVRLSIFSAVVIGSSVQLKWQTATELNNYGFQVERKKTKDKSEWENVGFVEGHGTTNSPHSYSYVDSSPSPAKVKYRLKQIDFDGKFEYSEVVEIVITGPDKFELMQNYPNPFNPSTTIKFNIPVTTDYQSAQTTLRIFNGLGEQVAELIKQQLEPGFHSIEFDASRLASGIYFYKLSSGEFQQTRKMILMK
ncbi:MAG: FG-GAP-like repeat-containing protein [Melioribacteraceae bacterium]|nr:FG-GAP-like repeat-containing protein [Melioribacteraceae bacterium]MCF8264398.1 FG-GAP-like repeat-containing protein [Melioribacteraceae bacterium]